MTSFATMRSALLRLGYRASAVLNTFGIGQGKVARSFKRLLRSTLTSERVLLIEAAGSRMYIYADTATTREYLARPFEPYTAELLSQSLRPGATFLDIGAQFGYFTLIGARAVGAGGRVYAFEPVPQNFRLLQRNVALNRLTNVETVPYAVANVRRTVEMFVYGDSDSHSMYRHPDAQLQATINVETVTVDEFLAGRLVDVIKMDIEGNEPYAVAGMMDTIAKRAGLVLFTELAPAYLRRGGSEPHEYLERLRSLGFEPRLIDERARALRPVTAELLQRAEQDPSWAANLYCTKTA